MTGEMIAQLLLLLGPQAVQLIQQLIANWKTPMTPDQVRQALSLVSTSYDQYIQQAQQALQPTVLPGVPPAK